VTNRKSQSRIARAPSSISLLDRLPHWAKVIFLALAAIGSVYYIAHYGLSAFLLHTIFSL